MASEAQVDRQTRAMNEALLLVNELKEPPSLLDGTAMIEAATRGAIRNIGQFQRRSVVRRGFLKVAAWAIFMAALADRRRPLVPYREN